MPIRPLLEAEGAVFGPDDVQALVEVFEGSLTDLRLIDRTDPAVLMVAKRVITLASHGERDPALLRERVVKSFGDARPASR